MIAKLKSKNGNEKRVKGEGSGQLINREELDWALDCVQTRNCRINLNIKDKSNGLGFEDEERDGENNDKISNNIPMENSEINEEDRLSVLAPFFDFMNHDKDVQTIFELKYSPSSSSSSTSSSTPSTPTSSSSTTSITTSPFSSDDLSDDVYREPVLTVRYDGHGVKKGEQVCLNYRRYVLTELRVVLIFLIVCIVTFTLLYSIF